MNDFWKYFNEVEESLMQRAKSLRSIFEYLDGVEGPKLIVETGCVRNQDPWARTGEGHSTILFDRFVSQQGLDSKVISVDINSESVQLCRTMVSGQTEVIASDSVQFLSQLAVVLNNQDRKISLLYFDSFDVDYNYWYPSAAHHLKELLAINSAISPRTLVVVDDAPVVANLVLNGQGEGFQFDRFTKPVSGGKGRLIAEYAEAIGAKQIIRDYQCGFTNLVLV